MHVVSETDISDNATLFVKGVTTNEEKLREFDMSYRYELLKLGKTQTAFDPFG